MVEAAKSNNLGFGIGEKDFATNARRQVPDIVRAQVVQKGGRVRTYDLDLASRGGVEESCSFVSLFIFRHDVHPAPLFAVVYQGERFMSILKEEHVPGLQKALRLGSSGQGRRKELLGDVRLQAAQHIDLRVIGRGCPLKTRTNVRGFLQP